MAVQPCGTWESTVRHTLAFVAISTGCAFIIETEIHDNTCSQKRTRVITILTSPSGTRAAGNISPYEDMKSTYTRIWVNLMRFL